MLRAVQGEVRQGPRQVYGKAGSPSGQIIPVRRLISLAAAFFLLINENKFSAPAVGIFMPFYGRFFGLFEACAYRPSAKFLPEPDAPLDQIRQAGALHDLRHGACSRV